MHIASSAVCGWLIGIIIISALLWGGLFGPYLSSGTAFAAWFLAGLAGAVVGAIYGLVRGPRGAPPADRRQPTAASNRPH